MYRSAVLTNVPRSDMPPRGNVNRGPHIYPFYDENLRPEYSLLPPPSLANVLRGPHPADPMAGTAMQHCWMHCNVTNSIGADNQPLSWPFDETIIVDANSNSFPTDRGFLDAEDLGTDVVNAVGPETAPRRNADHGTVDKPPSSSMRTRKYLLDIPPKLRHILTRWRGHVNTTYNAAIAILNDVYHVIDLPFESQLYPLLVNYDSDFVKKRPCLRECPSQPRRDAVDQAVASRRAILTTYWDKPASKRPPLPPLLTPGTSAKDKKRGFSLFFAKSAATIEITTLGDLRLRVSPVNVSKATRKHKRRSQDDSLASIKLRGQAQRRFLIDRCETRGKHHIILGPRHEWGIQLDRYGKWKLLFRFKVTQMPVPTVLNGQPKVLEADPGAATSLAIATESGKGIDIGSRKDADRLEGLRNRCRKLQSRRDRQRDSENAGPHQPEPSLLPSHARHRRRQRRKPPQQEQQHQQQHQQQEQHRSQGRRQQQRRQQDQPQTHQQRDQHQHRHQQSPPLALSAKKRRILKLRERTVRAKHFNLVREFHCRATNFLARAADIIIMPRMEVRGMIRRRGSRLTKATKDRLTANGHCALVNRLAQKSIDIASDARYPTKTRPTVLLVQPEAYTSKTCGQCGQLNDLLGSNRTFTCPFCGYIADRDRNGAHNMLIKAIRPKSSLLLLDESFDFEL